MPQRTDHSGVSFMTPRPISVVLQSLVTIHPDVVTCRTGAPLQRTSPAANDHVPGSVCSLSTSRKGRRLSVLRPQTGLRGGGLIAWRGAQRLSAGSGTARLGRLHQSHQHSLCCSDPRGRDSNGDSHRRSNGDSHSHRRGQRLGLDDQRREHARPHRNGGQASASGPARPSGDGPLRHRALTQLADARSAASQPAHRSQSAARAAQSSAGRFSA